MQRGCSRIQAERLSRAVQLRTVTIVSDDPASRPETRQFRAFQDFLQAEFPRARDSLVWERLGDLALLLTWKGSLPGPALLLYAHYDVVPPGDEEAWLHPPFSGTMADSCIWGRGTLDDKGALVSMMEAVEDLLAAGFMPARTVCLAFGGDEETTGGLGAAVIARSLASRGVLLSCVLDEGSFIAEGAIPFVHRPVALVGLAEKGFGNLQVVVRGRTGHSSMPGRGTAAGALAAVVAALEKAPFPARLTDTVARFFQTLAPHARRPLRALLPLIRVLWPLVRGRITADPSLDALVRTTMAVTILRAGEKENVLPAEAKAVINLRILPGETTAGARARIERIARRALPPGFSMESSFLATADVSDPVPETVVTDELWKAIVDSIGDAAPEAVVVPYLTVVYTDSRKFAKLTGAIVRLIPAVLRREDIALVHAPNERISFENYGRMIRFYAGMIRRLS